MALKKITVLSVLTCIISVVIGFSFSILSAAESDRFEGKYYSGEGDVEYLQLLDIARRMFEPDPEFQSIPMLYTPSWNGFVEGPKWNAWWIQNSYGPTYCALPFYQEPYLTFLQNAQALWFEYMGDGKKTYVCDHRSWTGNYYEWIPPDGCLVDAASPGFAIHRQGDGKVGMHDWCMGFTAAGLLMQSELLLISRDTQAIKYYLPKLERCANFIETRRDPKNNLFLAGPAGNLLAPSYAGWKKSDSTYDKAYLSELSITYIAALDRLIELEKLSGNKDNADLYSTRRDLARRGLTHITTEEGYFIKSLDPDGTKHGVYGAAKYGYFESVVNHDAIAFRVADDEQAQKIYNKIASIPQLRPYNVIIPNYPTLDDMYEPEKGIWKFGTWVNGGHWATCEARMIMSYYRLGKYEDARRSMQHLLTFARLFHMDSPMTNFGGDVWFKNDPINLCYDNYGAPAAMIRGLFEYLYSAEGLTILPHIPPSITQLDQRFPIRFGTKKLYLTTSGKGPITSVKINGKLSNFFDETFVFLPYDQIPEDAQIQIAFGGAKIVKPLPVKEKTKLPDFIASN
ncbi:MAG: hypothetical protein M1426_01550, partial [Patescibacteria group bacterium]|nr:hypothetical protein [Patescibacteria group bacterium]